MMVAAPSTPVTVVDVWYHPNQEVLELPYIQCGSVSYNSCLGLLNEMGHRNVQTST